MIRSTLALKLAGDIAPARKSTARPGFWKRLFEARQAQADRVARVTLAERGTKIKGVDGLITNHPGIPLMLRFADCVPIMLYDSENNAIGIAHAGWRGTCAGAVLAAVPVTRK